MGLSNLPPGVTESMIPGNRLQDEEFEFKIEHHCPKCDCYSVCRYVENDEGYENCGSFQRALEPDPDREYDEAHGK